MDSSPSEQIHENSSPERENSWEIETVGSKVRIDASNTGMMVEQQSSSHENEKNLQNNIEKTLNLFLNKKKDLFRTLNKWEAEAETNEDDFEVTADYQLPLDKIDNACDELNGNERQVSLINIDNKNEINLIESKMSDENICSFANGYDNADLFRKHGGLKKNFEDLPKLANDRSELSSNGFNMLGDKNEFFDKQQNLQQISHSEPINTVFDRQFKYDFGTLNESEESSHLTWAIEAPVSSDLFGEKAVNSHFSEVPFHQKFGSKIPILKETNLAKHYEHFSEYQTTNFGERIPLLVSGNNGKDYQHESKYEKEDDSKKIREDLTLHNDEFKTKELEKSVPADVSSILYQPFSEKVPDFESSKFTDDFHGSQITSAVVGEAMPATERGLELELLGHKQNYIAEEVPEEFKQMDHSSKSAPPKIPPKTKSIDLSTNEVTDIAPAVAAEKEEGTQVGTKKEETKNDEIHIISNEASSLVENISDRISNIADGLRETPIFSKSEISEALINKMEQKEEEKGPTNEFINTMEELKGEVEELVASKEKEVKEFLDSKKEEMVEGMVENVVGKVDDFEKQILSGTVKEVIADEPKPPISEHLGTLFVPTESQITDSSITETTFPQSEDMKHTVIEKPDNSKTAGLEKEKKSCTLKSRTSITNGQQTSRWRRCTVL